MVPGETRSEGVASAREGDMKKGGRMNRDIVTKEQSLEAIAFEFFNKGELS